MKDFYFDDNTWMIRYLVVETGTWLNQRPVLLTPHTFDYWDRDRDILSISLTRKQIEHGLSLDSHRPVSRQDQPEYSKDYGESGQAWDVTPFPMENVSTTKHERLHHGHNQRADRHLRSTKVVAGYEIHTTDGVSGSVRSFMVDDTGWAIGELVAEIGPWYLGKEILIPTARIERISYEESKIFVRLITADIRQSEENSIVRAGSKSLIRASLLSRRKHLPETIPSAIVPSVKSPS